MDPFDDPAPCKSGFSWTCPEGCDLINLLEYPHRSCPERVNHIDVFKCPHSVVKVQRWFCVGGAFCSIRLEGLEPVVERDIGVFYRKFNESDTFLEEISPGSLNYTNINENASFLEEMSSQFDRQVRSEVDFAKLFLEPHMCNFTSLKDCDLLTSLALLSKVPAFNPDVKAAAETVRMLVKEWAHCNPVNWDQAKSLQSFREMKRLVGVLPLASEVRSKLLGKLEFWENLGMEKAFFHPPPAKAPRTSRFMVKKGNPSEKALEELAQKIRAGHWRKLGRRLDINDAELDAFERIEDLCEKVYQMLLRWKEKEGSKATFQVLNDALCHHLVQNRDLAEKFCCDQF